MGGTKDGGGFQLPRANNRESSKTSGAGRLRTGFGRQAAPGAAHALQTRWRSRAKLTAMRLGEPPAGYGHWTLRLLADEMVALEIVDSISHETVRKVL